MNINKNVNVCIICGAYAKLWCNKTMVACSNKECANYRFSKSVEKWNKDNCKIKKGEFEKKEENPYFADAKVGDRVVDVVKGFSGVITGVIKEDYCPYPIYVKYDEKHNSCVSSDLYTIDGRYTKGASLQSLYWEGAKAIIIVTEDTPQKREPELTMCKVCKNHEFKALIIEQTQNSQVRCQICERNTGNFWGEDLKNLSSEIIPQYRRFADHRLAAINEWNRMNEA